MRAFLVALCAGAFLIGGALIAKPAQAQNALGDDGLPVVARALSLGDALHLAERDSVALMQSRAQSDSADASADGAKAALRPSVSATADAVNGNTASILGSSPGVAPQSIYSIPNSPLVEQNRIKLMIPLLTGGLLQRRAQADSELGSAAHSDNAANVLSVQEDVVAAYVNVLLNDALLASQQSRLAYEQEQMRITQQKVDTGALAPVDLLREEAARDDAETAIAQAQENIQIALVDLKTALGVSQTSNVTLSDTLDSLGTGDASALPNSLADAIHFASEKRPELIAAKARADSAEAQVRAMQAEYAPQVYAVGMAGAGAQEDGSSTSGYTVGVTASIPLYDGGARKADIAKAKAALASAQAGIRAAQQNIESNVAKAWFSLQSVQQQLVSAQSELVAAQKGYDLASLRYNAGKSTTADRLDALDALSHAQADLAQAQAMQVDARSEFAAALGIDPWPDKS